MLTKREEETVAYYDKFAQIWAGQRRQSHEPSFWQEELKWLEQPVKGKLLELGPAVGRDTKELTTMGYEVIGIDTSKELLKIAQHANPNNQFFCTTVYDLPFPLASFDAFFSWALLPHVPKQRVHEALRSIKRVLKQNAVGFFAMREGEGEKRELETGRWFSYYSEQECIELLQEAGFSVIKKGKRPSRPGLVWLTFLVSIS